MDGNGYPPETLARLQHELKNMLKVVAALCDEMGLTWFVEGGTCLGAVRHKGFIPWDDDVDITLPIDEYRIFCEVAPVILEGSGYGVYLPGQTSNYAPFFAKVYKEGTRFIDGPTAEAGFDQGIFIDVFPYMPLDSDPRKAERQIRDTSFWQKMSYVYHIAHPHIPSSTPAKPLVRTALVGAHKITMATQSPDKIYRRFQAAYADGNGQGLWMNPMFPTHGLYRKETLFPTTMLPFEDMMVCAPHDPHQYLIDQYGDYMTLPPESERHAHTPIVLDFGDGVNVMEDTAKQNGDASGNASSSASVSGTAPIPGKSMQRLCMEEIREIQLELLDEVHRICEEHGLTYFLSGGSLIGAARHQGFIPWDDDIDVDIPRKDYEIFVENFREWRSSDRFEIISPALGGCPFAYTVIHDTRTYVKQTYFRDEYATGVWVDVFPQDNIDPANVKGLRRIDRLYWLRYLAMTDPKESGSGAARIVKGIVCPILHKTVDIGKATKKLDDLCREQSPHVTGEVGDLTFERMNLRHQPLRCFKPMLMPFEDREYYVPEGYDEVLTCMYGDWRTPVAYESHATEAYRL